MSRAQVLGEKGGPILIVEETILGSGPTDPPKTRETDLIGEVVPKGELDGFYVLSGADVAYYLRHEQQLRQERGETVMDRAEWLDREQLALGVTLANGEKSTPINLPDTIKQVLVLGQRDRFGADPQRWILLRVPFVWDSIKDLPESASSVLFSRDGQMLRHLVNDPGGKRFKSFTFRTAYFGEGEGAEEQSWRSRPRAGDRIFGGLPGQLLQLNEPSSPPPAWTDERGMYRLEWAYPCQYPTTYELGLELALQRRGYNPLGSAIYPMYLVQPVSVVCAGGTLQAGTASFSLGSLLSKTTDGPNFYVDVVWLAGKVRFASEPGGEPLTLGDELIYDDAGGEQARAEYAFDFDGDGEPDTVVQANKKTVEEKDEEGNPTGRTFIVPDTTGEADSFAWQAVYFSSGNRSADAEAPAEQQPDLWRVADRHLTRDSNGRLLQGGKLKQMSKEAALNTDVYIFRDSTGELLVEVAGLPGAHPDVREWRTVDDNRAYTWNTLIRGPRSQFYQQRYTLGQRVGEQAIRGQQVSEQAIREGRDAIDRELGIQPRFIGRDSGVPGPGETLRIVAINRTTGYTGTATMTLGSPASGDNVAAVGSINQIVPDITLTPPNLKVWAKRLQNIEHGLTKDENVNYLIGHEGAATRNDTLVAIFTEWLDEYGKPLPDGLGVNNGEDFGLSGRLAKLTGEDLTPVSAGTAVDPDNFDLESIAQGNAVVEFGIKPGRQVQLIRLKSDHLSNEHYYVNVFGRAKNKEACPHCEYDQTGKGEGILETRPNHYTPFYVPRYDEEATLALRQEREAQRRAEEEAQAESGTPPADEDKLGKVDPQHAWVLRPEYQFSVIELMMNELQAVRSEVDGPSLVNLLEQDKPLLSREDDLLRLYYSLFLPESDPLTGFDDSREYVLAFGEEEILFTAGSALSAELTNLEHLFQLTPEDYLTIRLYLNHDPDNILWQWAFGRFALMPEDNPALSEENRIIRVSADDAHARPEFINGLLFRGEQGVPDFASVRWRVEGQGQVSPSVDYRDDGLYEAELRLPIIAGERTWVEASVDNDAQRVIRSAVFEVTPGKAHNINAQLSGETVVGSLGEVVIDLSVTDQFGNKVEDGTPVSVTAEGMLIKERTAVHDGEARVVLSGLDDAGVIPVIIKIDNKEITETIDVHDLDLSLLLPQDLKTGQDGMVRVTGQSSYGDLAGLKVHMAAHRGRLADYYVTLGAGGVAELPYAPGDYPGFAQISAKVGSRIASAQVLIEDPEGGARFT
ncbi:MAG: hypothetical protein V2I38_15960, partial [Alcanivoracaceae bacterium]|nr:hypothetical protein [Alcanivoracaceae bacterium]